MLQATRVGFESCRAPLLFLSLPQLPPSAIPNSALQLPQKHLTRPHLLDVGIECPHLRYRESQMGGAGTRATDSMETWEVGEHAYRFRMKKKRTFTSQGSLPRRFRRWSIELVSCRSLKPAPSSVRWHLISYDSAVIL
jgi:hypothetical protein